MKPHPSNTIETYLKIVDDITNRLKALGLTDIKVERLLYGKMIVQVSGFKGIYYTHLFKDFSPLIIEDRFRRYIIPNKDLHNFVF